MYSAEFGMCNSVLCNPKISRTRFGIEGLCYAMLSAIQSVPTTLRI